MTAVILEDRMMKNLFPVVMNVLDVIDWNVMIITNGLNEDFLMKLFDGIDRVTIKKINHRKFERREYSNILLSTWFWELIPTENILIFQCDTWLRKSSKHKIEDFLEWDYVGAPWIHHNGMVGNGGLSLRKKSVMLKVCPKIIGNRHNEDIICVNKMYQMNEFKLPPTEVAMTFSVETIYYDDPFGFHSPWHYIPPKLCDKLIKDTPFETKSAQN